MAVETENDLNIVWGIDGGLLKDAIDSALGIAEEIHAMNAEVWQAYDALEAELRGTDSCLEYVWGFDPNDR